jgi:hypothetical protein
MKAKKIKKIVKYKIMSQLTRKNYYNILNLFYKKTRQL